MGARVGRKELCSIAERPSSGTVQTVPEEPLHQPAVEVLVDGSGRLGALSYLVPDGLSVKPGDAVHVPFGRREAHGMVLGPSPEPERATREILCVYGRRAEPAALELARRIAVSSFGEFAAVAERLSPRTRRDLPALDAGRLELKRPVSAPPGETPSRHVFYLRAPLVEPAPLAAAAAVRLVADAGPGAQVLVLCPTKELVSEVLGQFSAGAARLDRTPPANGSSAWKGLGEGTVTVGVGTRQAALWSARHLTGIVVVEEAHPGHIEASLPYTNARDVALWRADAEDLRVVLIGATASPPALIAGVKVVPVGSAEQWPEMVLLDRNQYQGTRLVPAPLALAVAKASRAGQRPLVLAERRRAMRRCTRCGAERPCARCDSSTCRHRESEPCSRCGETRTRMVGWDADRLRDLFSDKVEPVSLAELSSANDAGLVVLFDLDPALRSPGLQPEAYASHLITTAAKAAGRDGKVVGLTSDPEHPLLTDLFGARDQRAVARRAWHNARDTGLPPFGHLVTVRCGQSREPRVRSWPGTIYGPRRVGDEWELLVLANDDEFSRIGPHLQRLRRGGKVRVWVSGARP